MGLRDGINWLIGREQPHERDAPVPDSLLDLINRAGGLHVSPWRPVSNREAMGVPAVYSAISLISNTIGRLSMQAWRSGVLLADEDTPRIMLRPDPWNTPRVFWRDTAFHLARRGEAWWFVAARDTDGLAQSLIVVDPREVEVERSTTDARRSADIIRWRGRTWTREQMRQITMLPDPGNPLRGLGPLQACGAAVSVAVEAQEWAANWFAGSPATTVIKSAIPVDADEAGALKDQWMAGAGNLPKVIDPDIESVTDIGVDPEKAQLSDVRLAQVGEVARMFRIPGPLLEYSAPGSSLTYTNKEGVWTEFAESCLVPNYLEPIEQEMSDLQSRSTIGRFSIRELLRADVKTRYDTYNIGVPLGIISVEQAQQFEGLQPGDVENRPIPLSPPAAIPTSLPQERSLRDVRCQNCGRLAARVTGRIETKCSRCGSKVAA